MHASDDIFVLPGPSREHATTGFRRTSSTLIGAVEHARLFLHIVQADHSQSRLCLQPHHPAMDSCLVLVNVSLFLAVSQMVK